MRIFIACILFLVTLFGCKSKQKIFESDKEIVVVKKKQELLLTQVLDQAAEQNKIVFIDIYTDWCLPCQLMDEIVFSDEKFMAYFDEHFINFKVNAEKGEGPDLGIIYNVKEYPTLLFVNPKGKVLIRKNGAAFQKELRVMADTALARIKTI